MPRGKALDLTQVAILEAAGLGSTEIAKRLGVRPESISRAKPLIRKAVDESTKKLADLQAKLSERLNIDQRVDAIATMVNWRDPETGNVGHAPTVLGAVRYANELDGIHPALERERYAREREERTPVPLFSLPAGAHVAISVDLPDVIDVTPDKSKT